MSKIYISIVSQNPINNYSYLCSKLQNHSRELDNKLIKCESSTERPPEVLRHWQKSGRLQGDSLKPCTTGRFFPEKMRDRKRKGGRENRQGEGCSRWTTKDRRQRSQPGTKRETSMKRREKDRSCRE